METGLDRVEIKAQAEGSREELEEVQAQRKRFEREMLAGIEREDLRGNLAMAAAESRLKNETEIVVRLYGTNSEGDCDVGIGITLPGRQPAAQQLSDDSFSVNITTASQNAMLSSAFDLAGTLDPSMFEFNFEDLTVENAESMAQQLKQIALPTYAGMPDYPWDTCFRKQDCSPGILNLEQASYDQVSGSFKFQVERNSEDGQGKEYADVTGTFSVTSKQTKSDNTELEFFNHGPMIGKQRPASGIERFLQGGSIFGE